MRCGSRQTPKHSTLRSAICGKRSISHRRTPRFSILWPSLRYDVKSANQAVGRFLGPGFYYKTFIKPQALWPAYQKVLSRFAAGGRPPAPGTPHGNYDKRYAHPDVLVVGVSLVVVAVWRASTWGAASGGEAREHLLVRRPQRLRLDERLVVEAGAEETT